MTHHNGSLQIFPEGERCHVVWIADLLPDALAGHVGGMMQQGMDAMKRKLEADATARLPNDAANRVAARAATHLS